MWLGFIQRLAHLCRNHPLILLPRAFATSLQRRIPLRSGHTHQHGLWVRLSRCSSLFVDPSFRALSARLKFTVPRHKFNKDSLPSFQHRELIGESCSANLQPTSAGSAREKRSHAGVAPMRGGLCGTAVCVCCRKGAWLCLCVCSRFSRPRKAPVHRADGRTET